MSDDPVRLIHAVDPPPDLVALVRDLDHPPPLPPDLRGAMRSRLPSPPSAPRFPWRGPTLAITAAAVGTAIVWSLVTTEPQAPPIRPEPVAEVHPPVPVPLPEAPVVEAPEAPEPPAAAVDPPTAAVARPAAAPPIPERPTAQDIRRVVAQNRHGLQRCYEAHGGGAALRLTVRLVIGPSGAPDHVNVDGPGAAPLHDCVADAVRGWRFPASREGVTVSYPIVFRSEEPAAAPAPAPTPRPRRGGSWWADDRPPPSNPF